MVTDNDGASTFWAGNPSDFSTFLVCLSVSSSLHPRFFLFSLLLTTFGSLRSFFLYFFPDVAMRRFVSIDLFLYEDRIVPAGSTFVGARRRLREPNNTGKILDPDRKPTYRSETRSANSWEQRRAQSLDFSFSVLHRDGLLTCIVPTSGYRIVLTENKQWLKNDTALLEAIMRKFDCIFWVKYFFRI